MDISEETIAQDRYKKLIQRLGSETLRRVLEDRSQALESARRGIKEQEPDNLTEEYVEIVADGMQKVAKIILEKRAKKG